MEAVSERISLMRSLTVGMGCTFMRMPEAPSMRGTGVTPAGQRCARTI
jgi:hypothetical protein